ncbi:hypothetical protein AVEN_95303-1 [Araneus ventricosus]|uniref:Uncharacterized protein n=1 Tax=Araneus ventricosus TaxID=182803 RepID=A0A4Y2KM71_ARAVE|nr:hypothetical protein AVEN_95303-1 [Araneus ventricosus]
MSPNTVGYLKKSRNSFTDETLVMTRHNPLDLTRFSRQAFITRNTSPVSSPCKEREKHPLHSVFSPLNQVDLYQSCVSSPDVLPVVTVTVTPSAVTGRNRGVKGISYQIVSL